MSAGKKDICHLFVLYWLTLIPSVTVMGQSAGASSILHHIVAGAGAAEFKPDFSRAILQSPAFFPEGDPYLSDLVYRELKRRLRAHSLEDLQKRPSFEIHFVNAVMTYYSDYGLFKFGPKVDNKWARRP